MPLSARIVCGFVRNDDQHFLQELDRGAPGRVVIEPHQSKFRRAINGYEQVKLAFTRPDFGDVDVKEPDGLGFEFLRCRQIAFDVGQSRYPMPLKAAMQRRAELCGIAGCRA